MTDDQIILRIREGDIDQYAKIIRRYQSLIWKMASFALRNLHDTEELVQKVFVQAYRKLESYSGGDSFDRWLKALARNLFWDELRKRVREDRKLSAYGGRIENLWSSPSGDFEPDSPMEEALRRCREQLPDNSAQALSLKYDQCRSFEEIAADLGRTVSATRQMLQRIRVGLRKCIEERMASA